ncbi:protein AGENET DOMAIN (AGD)-CONTAINING P1 [Ziziphus jujuba]|uniref:Protein AGENET DOMAIN (AGD)-CONTAINING P1 n=2 Tax=Ziziphus jujuba TaxID=326968 RepID=A0A6P6FPC8_ZIZJJ|nr:protein AGENET DOMAIN (AGD)-CONTAINING P1 [Ziziphus jujuba]KAH7544971.1 hypothetical protein FEM48_Zijuj01G0042700 [Ziziphus jujuba var. spinosa]
MANRVRPVVEICKKEEGSQEIYYQLGSILDAISNGNSNGQQYCKVEYRVRNADNTTSMVTEVVAASDIRPQPEPPATAEFSVSQKVNVYKNGGWRVGNVTAKVDQLNYIVRFLGSGNEEMFLRHSLRLHQDWVNGNWI